MSVKHTIVFIAFFFCIKQIPALQSPSARIIGGYEVEPHSIPYQVFLNITGTDGTWRCGGSLITQNYVLTAARCCSGAKFITVILGAHDLNEKNIYQVTLQSTNFTIYPYFIMDDNNFASMGDLAVIALPKPPKLRSSIQTIGLPNPYNDWTQRFANETGRISGWGLTDGHNKSSYSQVLLAQETRIMSDIECIYSEVGSSSYDICVQVNETDSPCIGDYGSPLTVGDIQVGIASQGYDDCDPYKPFMYTRISEYLRWIKENTDYTDDYTTQGTTEGTTKVTERTTTKKTTTTTITETVVSTTTDTSTTTGKAPRLNSSFTLLFLNLLVILPRLF